MKKWGKMRKNEEKLGKMRKMKNNGESWGKMLKNEEKMRKLVEKCEKKEEKPETGSRQVNERQQGTPSRNWKLETGSRQGKDA